MVTIGELNDRRRPRIVLNPVLEYSRGSEVGEGKPKPMRCEESDKLIVAMTFLETETEMWMCINVNIASYGGYFDMNTLGCKSKANSL